MVRGTSEDENADYKSNRPINTTKRNLHVMTHITIAPVAPTTEATTENQNVDSILTPLSLQYNSFISKFQTLSNSLNRETAYNCTDSEWDGGGKLLKGFGNFIQGSNLLAYYDFDCEQWILQTFVFTKVGVINSDNLSNVKKEIISLIPNVIFIEQSLPCFYPFIESFLTDVNADKEVERRIKQIELINKYSALDFHAYFGDDVWLPMVSATGCGRIVSQKRCIRFDKRDEFKKRKHKPNGCSFTYTLRDIQGLNTKGLKAQAASVGVKLHAKDAMDKYKSKMSVGYRKKPLLATVYCITDTIATFDIMLSYIPLVNMIIDALDLPGSEHINVVNLPHTTGALVGYVYQAFLKYYPLITNVTDSPDSEMMLKWQAAIWRHPLKRDDISKTDDQNATAIMKAQHACKNLADYHSHRVTLVLYGQSQEKTLLNIVTNDRLMRKFFKANVYEQACTKVIGSRTEMSSTFAAIVQGGRCNCSNPFEFFKRTILDVDLSSCYGTTLRKLTKAIGIPSIKHQNKNSGVEDSGLFETIDAIADELLPDLWMADVSTKAPLSFTQDLIFSSANVTSEQIRNAIGGEHYDAEADMSLTEVAEEIKKIPSDFALLRREIEHGRLCHSSFNAITKVATDKERGELKRKLSCGAIIYYGKSDRVSDLESWCDEMIADDGCISTNANGDTIDTRSKRWFPVSLELFVGKLVDRRGAIKSEMKKAYDEGKKDVGDALNAQQEMFKLFINTLYGDLASVYFSFGDVVLANVITDKARVGAWMLSKALRTMQEITDGGFYSPLEVAFIVGSKLPGLATLSHWNKWKQIRRTDDIERIIAPLGGLTEADWSTFLNECAVEITKRHEKMMDSLALAHIQEFWGRYELEFEFNLEHKYAHTSTSAGWLGKSDYCLKTVSGTDVIKKRGSNEKSGDPAFKLLSGLAVDDVSDYEHAGYNYTQLVKIGEFQNANMLKTDDIKGEPKTLAELKTVGLIAPGWSIDKERLPRQMNNQHVYIETLEEYKGIKKRRSYNRNERIQWFERYVKTPVIMLKRMNENALTPAKKNKRKK
jgi:hypothetical protein